MQKSTKVILIIILISLVLAAVYFFFFRNQGQQPQPTPTPTVPQFPSATTFAIPPQSADRMSIPTSQGSIETDNIYKDPAHNPANNEVIFIDNQDYSISFEPKDKYFLIVIQSVDIQNAREKAENALLQKLVISKDQACKLNVSLYVPYFASAKNAGQDFGLSFCPNGKPFTK